eukprot:COSAG06_NODE_22435_length_723_cov_1.506410_2_plen_94_part_00
MVRRALRVPHSPIELRADIVRMREKTLTNVFLTLRFVSKSLALLDFLGDLSLHVREFREYSGERGLGEYSNVGHGGADTVQPNVCSVLINPLR